MHKTWKDCSCSCFVVSTDYDVIITWFASYCGSLVVQSSTIFTPQLMQICLSCGASDHTVHCYSAVLHLFWLKVLVIVQSKPGCTCHAAVMHLTPIVISCFGLTHLCFNFCTKHDLCTNQLQYAFMHIIVYSITGHFWNGRPHVNEEDCTMATNQHLQLCFNLTG